MFKFPLSNLLAQHIWFHSKRKCQLTLLQPSQGRRPWQNPMLKTNQKKSFFFWNCHKSKWYITCFLDADGYVLKFSNPQNPMTYPYGLIARDLLAMQECHDNHEAGKVHKPRDASTVLWLWGVEHLLDRESENRLMKLGLPSLLYSSSLLHFWEYLPADSTRNPLALFA